MGNSGSFPRRKPAATESRFPTFCACWVFQCFHNPSNSDWTTGTLTCAQVLIHAIAHGGVWTHVRECALKVDSGRKIPCRTGKSNLRQRRDGPTLYQLSYIPTPQRFFFFFGSPRKLTKTPCESQLFSLLLFVWKFYFISIYETF